MFTHGAISFGTGGVYNYIMIRRERERADAAERLLARERERVELERQRADAAYERADAERQRAEAERQRANEAERRATQA